MEYGSIALVTAYDIVEVRIKGIRRSYPPVMSAIRKIAVIGACMTPAISPAIPTSTKFCSGTVIPPPMRLMVRDTTKPAIAPMNKVGPNVPPTPPPALVSDIENTFSRSTRKKNTGTIQAVSSMKESTVFPSMLTVPKFISPRMHVYPSPNRGGSRKISRPSPVADNAQRTYGFSMLLILSSSQSVILVK